MPDEGATLLEVLRDHLGARSAKDGCAPQGQCGCCTVWVDGAPRVACVTPARRVAGRRVTTVEGVDPADRDRWAEAFTATGASQCGFCTPGILMRLIGAEAKAGRALTAAEVDGALLAHLCRCTGWRTITEAAERAGAALAVGDPARGVAEPAPAVPAAPPTPSATPTPPTSTPPAPGGPIPSRDLAAAARRAALEGHTPQSVGPEIALGRGGFADDTAPEDALVAVSDGAGGWAVAETVHGARAAAAKVQGRRTTLGLRWPLEIPEGAWALRLATTWVEPAYLETDASWCLPGGEPVTVLANGGAFGGKLASAAPAAARELADRHGRPVRVLLSREDVVRTGPKRPPVAAGLREDGTGILRVARTPVAHISGLVEAVAAVAPGLAVEEVGLAGPPTSLSLRAAGWGEAALLLAVLDARRRGRPEVAVTAPGGGRAEALVDPVSGRVSVRVAAGEPLDPVVLRSYCIGAAHMALGWVRTEGLSVDEDGQVHDLTIRSFGILRSRDMPPVDVEIIRPGATGAPSGDDPVNGSDAVFLAVAGAAWLADGLPERWPHQRESAESGQTGRPGAPQPGAPQPGGSS